MGKPPYILNPLIYIFYPGTNSPRYRGFFMLVKVPLLLYYK
uniref:Uncharacterized protein n=2 Tax=unclassified Caudoviricetes TaxID=2788787 RepID=A0A8S5MVR2_9CAUD|nr:MAG TPA: hypothetical protein [Siphoviridae sp. ctsBB38]DAF99110.1 MAG TPA: hypothetical protein [Siphoviridae sp. ctOxh11]